MSFLRIAAVIVGLAAVPVLFASAETLASRVRDAERLAARNEATRSNAPDPSGPALPAAERRRHAGGAVVTGDGGEASRSDRSAAPSFGRVVINPNGASSFEGRSAPGAEVVLTIDARPLGEARADATGVWRLRVATPLAAGDHTISSAAKSSDRRPALAGQDIRIAIPEALMSAAVVAYDAPPTPSGAATPVTPAAPLPAADPLRSRAEDLAAAASQRFTEVTAAAKEPVADPAAGTREAAQAPPVAPAPAPSPRSRPQAEAADPPPSSAAPGGSRLPAHVVEWLERSAHEYQRTIVKGLSEPATGRPAAAVAAEPSRQAMPGAAPAPIARDGSVPGDIVTDAQIALQEWLARANRTYQTDIMRKLEQPAAATGVAAKPLTPAAKPDAKAAASARERVIAAETKAAPPAEVEAQKRRDDEVLRQEGERRRAEADKRAADAAQPAPPKPIEQVVPVAPPKLATPAPSDEDNRRKRAADDAAAAQAKAAEAKRQNDEAKRQSDEAARKQVDEARKAAEAATAKRREDEAKRVADKKAADEARKLSERTRAAETPAPKGEAPSTPTAADLARKAVEAARTGPAQRATEQKPVAEPAGKGGPSVPGATGASSTASRPSARKKDDRIAEGSGEKGPVDLPKPPRAPAARSGSAGSSGATAPQAGDQAGPTAAASAPRGRTCARAGQDIRPPGSYVVGSGDTLSEIAERHYGSARRMGRIVKANRRKLRDPDVIRICQRIWLP